MASRGRDESFALTRSIELEVIEKFHWSTKFGRYCYCGFFCPIV